MLPAPYLDMLHQDYFTAALEDFGGEIYSHRRLKAGAAITRLVPFPLSSRRAGHTKDVSSTYGAAHCPS